MKRYFRIVVLLCLLACITAGASALSQKDCEERGGWYADVHSDPIIGPNVVTTPILDKGRIYYITTAEIFWPDYSDVQADAQFYSMDGFSTWLKPESPPGTIHSFLQINEKDVNWGNTPNLDVSTWHQYTVPFTGSGEPITLRLVDWYDNDYSNNVCHLPVCIIPQSEGCTPGFWKKWTSQWVTYSPNAKISTVFSDSGPYGDVTLKNGLSLKGGNTIDGAKEILLRAAIAGLLDEAKFGDQYPYESTAALIEDVNAALGSRDRQTIINLASTLDGYNNQYCPSPK
jgi:hypothetical protein